MKPVSWKRRARALLLARAPRLFARWCTPDDRELGEWGEEIAARYLRGRGCRILGRRVKTELVEIDLVALVRGAVVCVEVKTGRLEPLPRPRGGPDSAAIGELRWRPGRRCDRSRIDRLKRAARALRNQWSVAGIAVRQPTGDSKDRRSRGHPSQFGAGRSTSASRDAGSRMGAQVDLIEVVLPMATRRPRVIHHPDIEHPLP